MIKYLDLKDAVKFPCNFEINGKKIKRYLKFSSFELGKPLMIFTDTYGNKAVLPRVMEMERFFNDMVQKDGYSISLENADQLWIPKGNILLAYEGD